MVQRALAARVPHDLAPVAEEGARGGVPEGALSGATVGLGFNTRALSLEVFNSRPVHVPSFMERESSQTYFRFSLSL